MPKLSLTAITPPSFPAVPAVSTVEKPASTPSCTKLERDVSDLDAAPLLERLKKYVFEVSANTCQF